MPAENIKLLPCPFCGGEAKVIEIDVGRFILCTECKVVFEFTMPCFSVDLITGWNRRAGSVEGGVNVPPTAAGAPCECCEAAFILNTGFNFCPTCGRRIK